MIFRHTLLDEFELRGQWTLAGGDRKVPGSVKFSPQHGVQLMLDQPFEHALDALKRTLGPEQSAYDVVQGETLDAIKITLFGLEGRPFGSFRARLMAIGECVTTESELRYVNVVAELEGLGAFTGSDPISGDRDKRSETVVYREPEPISIKLDETYTLSIEHHCAGSISFGRRSLEHRASLRVIAAEERPVADFFNGPLAAFQRLLELAAGRRVLLRAVRAESCRSLRIFGERTVQDHAALFFRQPRVPRPIDPTVFPQDLSFNIPNLGPEGDTVIRRWNERHRDFWPVTAFYFLLDPRFDLDTGLELHFLTAITAIEHLHRNTRMGRSRGKSEGLKQQLSDLVGQMPSSVAAIFGNLREFVTAIISNRSYLLHAQPINSHRRLAGRDLWKVLNGLRLMVFVSLLRQIGLDDGRVEQAAIKSVEFRRLQAYRRVEASNG